MSGGDGARRSLEMRFDHFPGGAFAGAATIRDGQAGLDVVQARCSPVQTLADLSIADSVAEADVHGGGGGETVLRTS